MLFYYFTEKLIILNKTNLRYIPKRILIHSFKKAINIEITGEKVRKDKWKQNICNIKSWPDLIVLHRIILHGVVINLVLLR